MADQEERYVWGETPKERKRTTSEDAVKPKKAKAGHRSLEMRMKAKHKPKERPRHWGSVL